MTPDTRNKLGLGLLGVAFAFLVIAVSTVLWSGDKSPADPHNAQQVSHGKTVYVQHCQSCHGANLEGQRDWRERLQNGRMPAPPHNATGHTWHHPDTVLFDITKHGLVPGKTAPPGYQSDMPAFDVVLSNEDIWAVLAFIKSSWPQEIRDRQLELSAKQQSRH